MMLKAAFQVLVLLASMQSATTPLTRDSSWRDAIFRTGDVARQLTEQDLAAIEMVLPSGSIPWLLNGDHGNAAGLEYVEAYLPPTSTTLISARSPLLRRGMVVTVIRRTKPLTEWTAQETRSYAQVAIPRRGTLDQIEGDQDPNRPFPVIGRFNDEELVTLVQFLRSDPPTRGPDHVQSWPILLVVRQADDSVRVWLRGTATSGQFITLRQSGRDWVIVAVGGFVA
jgi:hypothetical protein